VADLRAVQDRHEQAEAERLAPYGDRTVRLLCECGNVLDERGVTGWALISTPVGPHRGSQRRRARADVETMVTAGAPPHYSPRLVYKHRTRRCRVTYPPFTMAQLADAFIAEAERTESRHFALRLTTLGR